MVNKFFKSIFGAVILLGVSVSPVFAATITVSPGESIQTKCLKAVKAGDTCTVNPGTYSESLALVNTGTSSAPINIKCASIKGCTVNSGSSQTLVTGGAVHYYVIDGFRLISTSSNAYTVDFGANISQPITTPNAGNNNITVRNCYVEGTIRFFGANNLVENCELNGKSNWPNGLTDKWKSSHDNIYRNNTIHDYTVRSVWSMQYTDNILIENNDMYGGNGGVDCDSAASNQTRCIVKNNHLHDFKVGEGYGVILETCLSCIVEGNLIHDLNVGVGVINYGPTPDGAGYINEDGIEYRTVNTNTVIKNNIIYNTAKDGINCYDSPGATLINNTFYKTNQGRTYFGAMGSDGVGGFYCSNWTIKNNIFSQPNGPAIYLSNSSSGVKNLLSNYNFYDIASTAKKFGFKNGGVESSYTLAAWQGLGYDSNSKIGSPLFTNVSVSPYDFRPTSSSLACKAGEGGTYVGAYPCVNAGGSGGSAPTPTAVPKPGDVNRDGRVDVIDVGILIDTYGKGVSLYPKSDLNGDGIININDIGVVIDNYGK